MITKTHIATDNAAGYIGKLCRHFVHKIEATYVADSGRAVFPNGGVCEMLAKDGQLTFTIFAADRDETEKIKGVIERHLVKFAYKEDLEIRWEEETDR